MSLILEALRKLDREKQTPERGFLVVGAPGWQGGGVRRYRTTLGLALLAACAAVAVASFWPRGPALRREAQAPPITMAPLPTPVASSSPTVATLPAIPPSAPARPPASSPASTPSPTPHRTFTLTAISQQDGRPVAVLNDRLVREGDSFDGVRILRIGEAEVEIEVDGRRLVVGF